MVVNIFEAVGVATLLIVGITIPILLLIQLRNDLIKDTDAYVRDKYGLKERKGWYDDQ